MRKTAVVGVLGILLAVVSMFPFLKSDAAYAPDKKNVSRAGTQFPPATLPNYDIRLVGKGEFKDYDLNSSEATQSAAKNASTQARASAVDEFRSSLKAENAGNVRAV